MTEDSRRIKKRLLIISSRLRLILPSAADVDALLALFSSTFVSLAQNKYQNELNESLLQNTHMKRMATIIEPTKA
jgi:two-component sensor histidine kinase